MPAAQVQCPGSALLACCNPNQHPSAHSQQPEEDCPTNGWGQVTLQHFVRMGKLPFGIKRLEHSLMPFADLLLTHFAQNPARQPRSFAAQSMKYSGQEHQARDRQEDEIATHNEEKRDPLRDDATHADRLPEFLPNPSRIPDGVEGPEQPT